MRGAAEKANKNRAVKARKKEAGFQRPSQADESAVRDIRRQNLLGPAQYRGEDVVYVLLSNILEEERRMQTYIWKKSATDDA